MYRVLLVEDEALERDALRDILTQNIAALRIVGEARTGPEALRILDSTAIDLMLVDINIPGCSGLDVVRHLRSCQPQAKVIVVTAYDYFETARTALQLKVDEYLLKPVRSRLLIDTVLGCLRHKDAATRCHTLQQDLGHALDNHAYLEGTALVRRHVDWICEQQHSAPLPLLQQLAESLTALALARHLPAGMLRQHAENLRLLRLDSDHRQQVFEFFLTMTDTLFAAADKGHDAHTVRRALHYIEKQLSKGVTLDEVAAHAGVSPSYLSKLFKKSTQVNFLSYVTARRMELAKDLLRKTTLPITDIALQLSFNDLNYFSKLFKKETGLSPGQYRRGEQTMNEEENLGEGDPFKKGSPSPLD